ncbi:MAG: hypothetical protein ACE5GY_07535 [Thermodesulfobacteriota bacterium]
MAKKEDLQDWPLKALAALGGSASIVKICEYIWENYKNELRESGDLFYTWQYDIRWAAQELRNKKILRAADLCPKGIWQLNKA